MADEQFSRASSSTGDDTWVPKDAELEKAVVDLAEAHNLEDISSKKLLRMIARKLGASVDDLSSKKGYINQCLKKELEKQDEGSDPMPTEQEIEVAAEKLAVKVDMESTSFRKFTRILCDDLNVEDLTPAKSILRKVYDDAMANAEQAKEEQKPKFPSDKKIVKSCNKLAASSKIDLEDVSKSRFLHLLQKRMGGLDLSPKKELVYLTLHDLKAAQYGVSNANKSMQISEITTTKPTIDESIMSMTATTMTEDPSMITAPVYVSTRHDIDEENQKYPESFPEKPRKGTECQQGWRIPEAKDLEWTDNFFDDDVDDLVAVFDHDYDTLLHFFMKVAFLSHILPIVILLWVIAILCLYWGTTLIGIILISISLLEMVLATYGWYRIIQSQIYAYHVAVLRDGVRLVFDDHLEGQPIIAALHCFDVCLLVSRQDEMIPFDRIVNFRTKAGGEVYNGLGCCCLLCCGCCLKVPFHSIEMKTAVDTPTFCEGSMFGLFHPGKLDKLVWGMKRDKGEQILRDANSDRANIAKHAYVQQAVISDQRAQESQNMMQMMSMLMQHNHQMMMRGNNGGQSPQSCPSMNAFEAVTCPPPPPPTG